MREAAGFRNAFGYEVQNYIDLRSPSDLEHFRFDPMPRRPGGWGSMTRISWPDDTFDFVSASSVFEHVVDQELAYREIHRVLKPGGSFLFTAGDVVDDSGDAGLLRRRRKRGGEEQQSKENSLHTRAGKWKEPPG